MRRILPASSIVIALVLLSLFIIGAAEVHAQTAQACQDQLTRTKTERDTAIDLAEVRERRIVNLTQPVTTAEAKAMALDDKNKLLSAQLDELKKQIATLEDNVKLSQQNTQLQQNIAQNNEKFIAVQQTAIDALVRTSKRSALERAVDALPSIAGIIAIALTHR